MMNYKNYINKNSHAMRSEIPNCICKVCEMKRNNPSNNFQRKPESQETKSQRKYEGYKNRCKVCFEAKAANGSCSCDE